MAAPLHAVAALRGTRPFRLAITVLILVLVAMLGMFGGTAYGYFSGSGSATGAASVGSLQPLGISPGVATTRLLPGDSADLYLVVTNPNGALTITGISQASGSTIMVTGGTGCTASNANVSVPTETGLAIALANGKNTITIPEGVTMGTASYSGCQNATFSIPVQLTVKS